MIRKASFHRRSHSQGLVDAAKIVIRMIDRNHVAVILKFLRERIGQPREAPHAHSEIQILPLDEAGRDVLRVWRSAKNTCANADAPSRV